MTAVFRMTMMAVLVFLVAGAAPAAAQAPSIVFLDSERLRQEAPGIRAASQRLEERMPALEAQADSAVGSIRADLEQRVAAFRAQSGMMTPEMRAQDSVAITQGQVRLQQEAQRWQQRADSIQASILAPVLNEINTMIQQLRAERGYAYILDRAAGGVLAADPSLDITDEVLQMLRAQANDGS